MYFSKCIPAERRSDLQDAVENLGGSTVTDDSFTHFVTCPPEKGSQDRGFVKSLNLLIALAAGITPQTCTTEYTLLYMQQKIFHHKP